MEIIWGVALQTNSPELKQACLNFMTSNLEGLMGTSLFSLLDFTSLIAILSGSVEEEIKFRAACSWVSHKDGRGRLWYTDELFSMIDLEKVSFDVSTQTIASSKAFQVR